MKAMLLGALMALLVMMVAGCGLMSGTIFVSQAVTGNIGGSAGAGPLDDTVLRGAVVDLTDNGDLNNVDVDGIEDLCVVTHAVNNLATPVEGEVWVTTDTTTIFTSIAAIQAAGGFRIFNGIALEGVPSPDATHDFTCAETMSLIENLDLLAPLITNPGYFKVWALAEQGPYDFEFSNIYFGMHVTGSL